MMNLMVCCTPLQVLIAEKIIQLYPNEDFYGLMITPVLNKKYEYYFEKLSHICKESNLIVTNNYSRFLIYLNVLKVKFLFSKHNFIKIFIANINDNIIQSIITKFPKAELYTFDDGTINITEGNFGTSKFESIMKKTLRVLLNFRETIDSLKERSYLHYTIYADMKNMIPNTQVIKLMDCKKNLEIDRSSDVVKIMLGQPIFNDDMKNKEITNKVIEMFNVDYYFPHPREIYKIEGIKYINTSLIFEDYFIKELIDKECIIYNFFSTSVLNIYHTVNAKIIMIQPKELDSVNYDIFNKLGFKIMVL